MKICVLVAAYGDTDSALKEVDLEYEPERWLDGHTWDKVRILQATAAEQIEALAGRGYDVFLNLCDGPDDLGRAGLGVVEALEGLGLPYTGPDPRLYALSKEEMKATAGRLGVATPPYRFVRDEAEVREAGRALSYPLIVKPADGYGSVGITARSKVDSPEALEEAAAPVLREFGAALVEGFVAGGEVTVLVVEEPDAPGGARILQPMVCGFPPGETFKHFDLKWLREHDISWSPLTDGPLIDALAEATRRIFIGIGGIGYSRCDFRIDGAGRPLFLEINTNCAVFTAAATTSSADSILACDPLGHRGFISLIVAAARRRRGLPPR